MPVILRMTFADAFVKPKLEVLMVERLEYEQDPKALGKDRVPAYAVKVAGKMAVEVLNAVLRVFHASLYAGRVYVVDFPSYGTKERHEFIFGVSPVAEEP